MVRVGNGAKQRRNYVIYASMSRPAPPWRMRGGDVRSNIMAQPTFISLCVPLFTLQLELKLPFKLGADECDDSSQNHTYSSV